MTEVPPTTTQPPQGSDPLLKLHKMSRTAGLGSTDYVAVNPLSVAALLFGVGSALVTLDAIFLAVPVVAIVLALVALRQIRSSNGTQTGRGLAWAAVGLAILFSVVLGSRRVAEILTTRDDKQRINQLIIDFGTAVSKRDYAGLYAGLGPEIRGRVTEQDFAARFNQLQDMPEFGAITRMEGNDKFAFDADERGRLGSTIARVFLQRGAEDRIPMSFRFLDGKWVIDDIPNVFPKEPTILRPGQRVPSNKVG